MTTEEWWLLIADFTKSGDWNGVLVAADGLEENGDPDTADGLRWTVRNHPPQPEGMSGWVRFAVVLDIDGVWRRSWQADTAAEIRSSWDILIMIRRRLLEQLQ